MYGYIKILYISIINTKLELFCLYYQLSLTNSNHTLLLELKCKKNIRAKKKNKKKKTIQINTCTGMKTRCVGLEMG